MPLQYWSGILSIQNKRKTRICTKAQQIHRQNHRHIARSKRKLFSYRLHLLINCIMRNSNTATRLSQHIIHNIWQCHTNIKKCIRLTGDNFIKFINAYPPNPSMRNTLLIHNRFPNNILRPTSDCLNQKTCTIIIPQQLLLHLNIRLAGRRRIHCIVFVFHLHIDFMNDAVIIQFITVRNIKNNVPTTFLSIQRHMTVIDVRKQPLMKITDFICIRFIALPKNLIRYDCFPILTIHSLIKNHLDRVNNIGIEFLDIIWLQLLTIMSNRISHMTFEIIICNK